MQKYFTKEITQPLKVIVLGLAIGLGVSFVSANWTAPMDGAAPGCVSGHPGCDAPINVSTTDQGKGGNPLGSKLYVHGILTGDSLIGMNSLDVGGPGAASLPSGNANIYGQLKLDLSGNSGTDGTDALNLMANSTADHVGIIQNKPWVTFWNGVSQVFGGINAGSATFNREDAQDQDPILQVNRAGNTGFIVGPGYTSTTGVDVTVNGRLKVNDGTQGTGKVFVSTDGNGQGAWGDLSTSGGIPLSGNDVMVLGRYYDNDGSNQVHNAWIYCPANYMAITGGGDCEAGGIKISQPIHSDLGAPGAYAGGPGWSDQSSSNPGVYTYLPGTDKVANYGRFPNGWQLTCGQGAHDDLHINVVCLKITPTTVAVNLPTPQTPTPPPTPGTTWHYASPANSGTINCWGANNTTNGNVGVVKQTLSGTSANGPWVFNAPANLTNVDTTKCPVNSATSPAASAGHLPTGLVWTGVSTGNAVWSAADQEWTKTRYWMVKNY